MSATENVGAARRVYTVGHSTRSGDDFLALLRQYDIATLADIRTVPRSRHNPQFNTEELARTLPSEGIAYVHLASSGGFNPPGAMPRMCAPTTTRASWSMSRCGNRWSRSRPLSTRACIGR
ncbi:MAG TPA: DUF488 domain-containing protein [Chloroflexota bacterium]